jgi:hypothetical protein
MAAASARRATSSAATMAAGATSEPARAAANVRTGNACVRPTATSAAAIATAVRVRRAGTCAPGNSSAMPRREPAWNLRFAATGSSVAARIAIRAPRATSTVIRRPARCRSREPRLRTIDAIRMWRPTAAGIRPAARISAWRCACLRAAVHHQRRSRASTCPRAVKSRSASCAATRPPARTTPPVRAWTSSARRSSCVWRANDAGRELEKREPTLRTAQTRRRAAQRSTTLRSLPPPARRPALLRAASLPP